MYSDESKQALRLTYFSHGPHREKPLARVRRLLRACLADEGKNEPAQMQRAKEQAEPYLYKIPATCMAAAKLMLPSHRYYYLHNFQKALNWIGERYTDLLDETQQVFLDQFWQLPQHSQALLVRLLMRRGPWFLQRKLVYDEIPEVTGAVFPLLNFGWLDTQQPLVLDELFALHTKAELLALFTHAPIHSGMRKAHMLDALRYLDDADKTYAAWNPDSPQAALRLMVRDLDERFRLMFFGNLRQGWSEFVLADLGVFKYEEVTLDAAARAFQTREDVDCYVALHRCRQDLDDGGETSQALLAATQCVTANPWLQMRRAKLLLRIGQACERAQDWELAQEAYAQTSYPGTRHRRMRVYERTARFADALSLAKEAQAAPENEEESQRVQRMISRLERRLGNGISRRTGTAPSPQIRLDMELDLPVEAASVEWVLRDHWHSEPTPVFYVENALINSLFGLLCWPAIFAPQPGAFFHPFQNGPADLAAPDFVQRREQAFDACLRELDDGTYRETIRQRYSEKHGVQSPFLFWGALSEGLMGLALECIPNTHLKLLFLRLLRDLNGNRTGFPDLVRFWPAEQRYELVEVKGPGDKLQDNQIRWLQYFSEYGIPATVCHVRWRDTTETQQPQLIDAVKAVA